MASANKSFAVIFLALVVLQLSLAAQEAETVGKLYCPYCGSVNFVPSKFCGACGSKLPKVTPPESDSLSMIRADSQDPEAWPTNDDFTRVHGAWKEPSPPGSVEWMMTAGLLSGTAGLFVGGFVGAQIDRAGSDGYEEFDGLYGFVLGAPIGEAVLLPVGIHLANGRRGNLGPAIATSLAIAGAGILTAAAAGNATILLSIPVAQLIACTAIERSSGGSR